MAKREESLGLSTPVNKVPEWLWNLFLTLIVVVGGSIFVTGMVSGRLVALEQSIQRLEARMDAYFGNGSTDKRNADERTRSGPRPSPPVTVPRP